MDKRDLYRKRAKQFYYAFLSFISLLFVGSLATYPFFNLPLSSKVILQASLIVMLSALFSFPLAFFVRKRIFPVRTAQDIWWSYSATKGYFWSFVVSSTPFAIAFVIYLIIASLVVISLGYLLSFCALILLRPKEEDIK
ncbi:hypothetical protein [Hydrogenobacter hydrogenophilus]|uniref:hypothetical protein n=1 Tax=Hydrogenobacter hydrogenophilus TaxID=35835 RepID=UPI000BBC8E88|nr:hypothetical protein [Hydrogenobacter hydrogenophilus]